MNRIVIRKKILFAIRDRKYVDMISMITRLIGVSVYSYRYEKSCKINLILFRKPIILPRNIQNQVRFPVMWFLKYLLSRSSVKNKLKDFELILMPLLMVTASCSIECFQIFFLHVFFQMLNISTSSCFPNSLNHEINYLVKLSLCWQRRKKLSRMRPQCLGTRFPKIDVCFLKV